MIYILMGSGSALETFKKLTTAIMMFKRQLQWKTRGRENVNIELENLRGDNLIDAKKLEKPDIDKLVVTSPAKKNLQMS